MVTQLRRPTLEDMLERAEALVPGLRQRAAQTETERHVPRATIEEFLDAGLFRVLQPERFGGYQLDYGRTQTELCNILGRGCGSSAWVQCVVACHAWILGMFAPEAQDAVWQPDPDTLIGTAFSSNSGRARSVDGGYFVEGDWSFSSGSDACSWIILSMPVFEDGPAPTKRIWALLPRRDWEIVDVWFAAGLRGSASNDIRVAGAFVPPEFTVDPETFDGRPTPGSVANSHYIYRLPLFPVFSYNVSTPALGIARGALEAYIQVSAARPERAAQPQRQLRIAESAAEIDTARAVWLTNAANIERIGSSGGPWPTDALTRVRRDAAFATSLCVRAVDRLTLAVGAHGMDDDNPVQRAWRDVHAVANHTGNNWDLQAVPWARDALGLPPIVVR
jgi:3-hydroxy-9,10-secoandrosta-1,3,5(10)-triene-9,17-dione monooxygenase